MNSFYSVYFQQFLFFQLASVSSFSYISLTYGFAPGFAHGYPFDAYRFLFLNGGVQDEHLVLIEEVKIFFPKSFRMFLQIHFSCAPLLFLVPSTLSLLDNFSQNVSTYSV